MIQQHNTCSDGSKDSLGDRARLLVVVVVIEVILVKNYAAADLINEIDSSTKIIGGSIDYKQHNKVLKHAIINQTLFVDMPINPFSSKEKKEKDNGNESEYTAGMSYIHENLIGNHAMVQSPYGDKRMTYADYTASGRSLYMIENYISKYVMSYYGNTHTSTSFASMQTSKFRDDSKTIIRRCINASADDAVIFVGNGATGAIHKLIGVLGLNDLSVARSTVVFLGPYEHHSNILPWKETGATLVRINEDRKGQLDMEHLESQLKSHASEGQWRMLV